MSARDYADGVLYAELISFYKNIFTDKSSKTILIDIRQWMDIFERNPVLKNITHTVFGLSVEVDLPQQSLYTAPTTEFIRGCIESTLYIPSEIKNRSGFSTSTIPLDSVLKWLNDNNIKYTYKSQPGQIVFSDYHIVDFLSVIYDSSIEGQRNEKMYRKYLSLVTGDPILPVFNVVRADPRAILPSKKSASDVGYDLTIISKVKDFGQDTTLYDTGVVVQPPFGYYVEIVPRSSLSKSGYLMSNSIAIIDPSYTGTLKVPLTRIDKSIDELSLPFTGFQLILRKHIHGVINEVKPDAIIQTSRGEGGFGSTGSLNQHK